VEFMEFVGRPSASAQIYRDLDPRRSPLIVWGKSPNNSVYLAPFGSVHPFVDPNLMLELWLRPRFWSVS
jgi:hypothetical protein